MRCLERNKRTVYYALYMGERDCHDDDGNRTGEKELVYSTPVKVKVNISGGRGQAQVDVFGVDNPFTRTVELDDMTTPFTTDTIWWFDADPDGPHNYRCTGVSKTLNSVVIALAEVDYADDNH